MIIGLGIDQVDIRRIEKTYARFGERFLQRCFTEVEQAKALRRQPHGTAATLAKRYAAKEACAKALGTGLNQGVAWRDMGVVNLASGKPVLRLTAKAKAKLDQLTPDGQEALIHLTITDEYPYATSQVLIEACEKSRVSPSFSNLGT